MDICEKMRNYLIDYEIATENEISLVESIDGANEETYKNILYSREGYRDFDQIEEDFYN